MSAPVVTVDTPKITAYVKIDGYDWEYNGIDEFSAGRTGGIPLVTLSDALAHTARAVAAADRDRDHWKAIAQAFCDAAKPSQPVAGELPPLPDPYGLIPVYADDAAGTQTHEVDGWTADQVRGYAIDYGMRLGRAALAAQPVQQPAADGSRCFGPNDMPKFEMPKLEQDWDEPAAVVGQDTLNMIMRDIAELDYSSDTVLDRMEVSEADLRLIIERHTVHVPAAGVQAGAGPAQGDGPTERMIDAAPLPIYPFGGVQAGCGKCPKETAYGPATTAKGAQVGLSDEQIIEIATTTRTAEANKDGGYILPISFARAILAAAKKGGA